MTLENRKDHPLLGIMLMALAVMIFSCINGLFKMTDQQYPSFETVFFRFLFAMIPCMIAQWVMYGRPVLKGGGSEGVMHAVRAVIGVVGFAAMFISLERMKLADATALMFSSTLFITVLSGLWLQERIGLMRWSAVLIGLIGIIIVANPGAGVFAWVAIFPLASAFVDAVLSIHTRQITARLTEHDVVWWFTIFSTIISGLSFFITPWKMPTLRDFLILATIGFFGGIGQLVMTAAYRLAEASVVAPVIYTGIIWGGLIGVFFLNEAITPSLIQGSALIILSSLIVIRRHERRRILR